MASISPGCEISAPQSAGFSQWLDARRRFIDTALSSHVNSLKPETSPHSRLPLAVQYSLLQPGKRVRPLLVLESCRVCGGQDEDALPAAIAIECVHTFSLIHDDLPAMDDDDLRRGVPTNHKVYGEAHAILAGDWLSTHAFRLLAGGAHPGRCAAWVTALAEGTEGMIVGQTADIEGESLPTDPERVRFIHRHKTACLIEAACRLGAIAADAASDAQDALARYGRHLGLAFQIVDDLLDKTGATAALGKRAGKDEKSSKQTFPAAYGLEQSRRQAAAEVDSAVAALEPFGDRAGRLREMARFVLSRDR